jgi:hypothetical protein
VASASASLSGIGLTPALLGITPGQLVFPATLVGQQSAAKTVTVKNSGGSAIHDLQLSLTAGFALDAATTTCGTALGAGVSCVAGVVFAPVMAGVTTGAITASTATGGSASATAALTGTGGLAPGVVTTPSSLVQFGTTGVGLAGTPVTVTVTNAGTAAALMGLQLAVNGAGAQAGFGLAQNTCGTAAAPGMLAAGASCTVEVTFQPAVAGAATGTLQLTSSNGGGDGMSPGTATLALAGIGFDFRFTVLGNASASVVRGQTAYYTFAVSAVGGTGANLAGPITFACQGLPANTLCVFNPPDLTGLGASGTANVVLGIGTQAPAAAVVRAAWPGGWVLLAGFGFWFARGKRGRRLPGRAWLAGLLAIGMLSGVLGCAGSGSSSSEIHLGGGTTPGSYTIQVSASSTGLTHSYPVTLVVN